MKKQKTMWGKGKIKVTHLTDDRAVVIVSLLESAREFSFVKQ